MDLSAINGLNIRTPATTTGMHILRIQGLNFPSFPILAVSTICPMVISVNASTHRATRNSVPTAEYLRIEYHKKRAGQHKEKIIAEVAKHITDLIPETKFSFHVTCPLLKVNLSLSIKKLYHKCRKILRIIFVVISTIFVFYGIIQKKCSINIML